jgi:Nucleotidyl transferase AbiEii toxin, Type IV TA system
VAEYFFELSQDDQRDALEQVRAETGRPTHLLEKDVWVVWSLRTLFDSPLAVDLTFKGGTSLSKAYKIIDRFSEDIDLTCDIRKLIADLIGSDGDLPANRSQADKWTKAVRKRLPDWIATVVRPIIQAGVTHDRLDAKIELEFGGRATGEPHQVLPVTCEMEGHLPGVSFPAASPLVMTVSRTFWEKATAAHVYCAQGRIRSERYARHWHDLAAIGRSGYFADAIADRGVAVTVARHKSLFFVEKDAAGAVINYSSAVDGYLQIVPEGEARKALASDYAEMVADEVMVGDALSFDHLMQACGELQAKVNECGVHSRRGQ